MRRKNKWISWLMMGLMLTMALMPLLAFAQGADPAPGQVYTLSDDDLSKKTFIDPLFGPLIGGGESPLTGLMLVFNGILLTVGGILVMYTILAGALSTAHDGEMLGKRWSTLWVPVRTSLGAAAMMPVVGGGWCVAQVIVIWLAMQGAAMANVLWSKFIDNGAALITSATYTPPSSLTAIRQTYTTMFINATCVASNEGAREASGSDAQIMGKQQYTGQIITNSDSLFWIAYGSTDMIGMMSGGLLNPTSPTDCGTIALREETNGVSRVWNGATNNTGSMLLDIRSDELIRPISTARRAEFVRAKQETDLLAVQLVRGTLTQAQFNQKMDELLQSYSTNLSTTAKTVFSANVNDDFLAKITQDGWVNAGAFYMQLARTQDQITRTITNAPVMSLPKAGNSRLWNAVQNGWELVAGADSELTDLDKASEMVSGYSSASGGGVSGVGQDAVSGGGEWSTKFVNWFINEDSALGVGMADSNENPIIMAKNLGDKMTATAWGAMAAATVAAAVIGTAQGTGTAPVTLIAPIFMIFFSSLIVPGAIMSTYLPMMPYIMWLGVVLAWAIMLIEAIIAAPLWALVHLAPDGDGVVGRGGQGYMLVLSLVLRPPLMIIGLVASFVLMKPIGFLVNSTFVGAFSMSVTPGMFGLTQMVAGCIIYCVVMMMLVQRVFSLTHVIPDRLLRWIGGDQGGVGEQAQVAGEGLQRAGVALGAHQAIGGAVQNAAGQFGANKRQDRNIAATRDAEKAQSVGNAERQLDEDWHQANASGSKADRYEDANSQTAAASAFEKASRSGYRTAEQQASMDQSSEAKDFRSGLSSARQEGPAAEQQYLQSQGQQAAQSSAAYQAARGRISTGQERPGDRDIVSNHSPRQFQESLSRGYQANQEAQSRYAKLSTMGEGGGSDSVRDTRREGPPPAAPGPTEDLDPNQ